MASIRDYLDPGEQLISVMRTGMQPAKVPLYFALGGLLLIVLFGLPALALASASGSTASVALAVVASLGFWLALIALVVAFVRLDCRLDTPRDQYALTDRRVIYRGQGRTDEVPLSEIEAIDVEEWAAGGSLYLRRRNGLTFTVFWIPSPAAARRQILELKQAAG